MVGVVIEEAANPVWVEGQIEWEGEALERKRPVLVSGVIV